MSPKVIFGIEPYAEGLTPVGENRSSPSSNFSADYDALGVTVTVAVVVSSVTVTPETSLTEIEPSRDADARAEPVMSPPVTKVVVPLSAADARTFSAPVRVAPVRNSFVPVSSAVARTWVAPVRVTPARAEPVMPVALSYVTDTDWAA